MVPLAFRLATTGPLTLVRVPAAFPISTLELSVIVMP